MLRYIRHLSPAALVDGSNCVVVQHGCPKRQALRSGECCRPSEASPVHSEWCGRPVIAAAGQHDHRRILGDQKPERVTNLRESVRNP